jgi:uncharacterized protein
MIARDEVKTSALRMLISAVRYTGNGRDSGFTDEEVIGVVQKELKKRKESADGFRQGGREDAALKEEQEAKLLQVYLPAQLSDEELTNIVEATITEVGAQTISDMGKVMGAVKEKVGSAADPSRISMVVKERLT